MAWGSTYTASGTWQNAAAAAATCTVTWNVTLASAPSGGNGCIIINTTSGIPPSGALGSIGTTSCTIAACVSGSSGVAYAIVGHSIIA